MIMEKFKKQTNMKIKNSLGTKKISNSKYPNLNLKSSKDANRGLLLEKWRQEKGISKKESCHPLLSRKRSLAQTISSPSYKSAKFVKKEITSDYAIDRRRTFVISKENQPSILQHQNSQDLNNAKENYTDQKKRREKRKTIHIVPSSSKPLTSPKPFLNNQVNRRRSVAAGICSEVNLSKTPWKNETLSRRERLDLWLAAKGKTPHVSKRRSYAPKSPHPNKKDFPNHHAPLQEMSQSDAVNPLPDDISNQLLSLLEDDILTQEERQLKLEEMKSQHGSIEGMSDYWICKARLAATSGDVQRVISLLEEAHTVQAKPEEKIREEICRFLQQLEHEDYERNIKETTEDRRSKFAITPGRRVHFAATDSPVEFKSKFIRFCIVESKAFQRRLNVQLKKKVMTPVRRSTRLRRSDIPQFLRDDADRIIDSPTQVEDDIIDGNIGFVPSNVLNTPLNKGWLIDEHDEDDNEEENGCPLELSFM